MENRELREILNNLFKDGYNCSTYRFERDKDTWNEVGEAEKQLLAWRNKWGENSRRQGAVELLEDIISTCKEHNRNNVPLNLIERLLNDLKSEINKLKQQIEKEVGGGD